MLFAGHYLFSYELKTFDEDWNVQNGLHYTMIFKTYVFMQVFNEVNCRKIHENEFNVFDGLFGNSLFLMVIGITVVTQLLLVEYGGEAVKCTPLTLYQNLICILIGSVSILFGFIVKLLPIKWF